MLTQAILKENLHYNPKTGIFTRLNFSNKKSVGHTLKTNYITITVNYKSYLAHRLAWMYCYGGFPSNFIDHIDGDKSNNKLNNLRVCTNEENQRNAKLSKRNTSGFKGVTWCKKLSKWKATATLNKRNKSLGYFFKKEDASKAYNDFAKANHGEFYRDTTIGELK